MNLKSLLFGSAAVLAAGTGAQAADLPVAEPVEYVRICDAFGTGFYYIPGTDTCLRVSGQVRVEWHAVHDLDNSIHRGSGAGGGFGPFLGGAGREFNNYTTRARGNVRLDARTQTDFGLVRAYIDLQMTVGPSDFATNYDSASPDLASAFIQISRDWVTYTAGHTGSFFDFWGSNTFGTRISIDDNTTEQTLFGFTFPFGNGFSFTVATEDPASSGRRLNSGISAIPNPLPVFAFDNYEGQEFPDGVVNLRVDQGWGSAQIAGVVHHIHDKCSTVDFNNPLQLNCFELFEGADDEDGIGYAVGAGANFNLPFFGLVLNSWAGWSEGAIGYVTSNPLSRGYFLGIQSGDFVGPTGDDSQSVAFVGRAGLTGQLAPNLTFHIDGSYSEIETEPVLNFFAPKLTVDLDYEFWAVVANIVWEPVPGLTMGPEVGWNHLELEDPAGTETFFDGDEFDVVGGMWRVQRAF
jgi:hypothetical protein